MSQMDVRRRMVEGDYFWLMKDWWWMIIRKLIKLRKFFTHYIFSVVFIKLRKFFTHCLLIAELIKLRKFFTHCQLKEVFIKLKQVSEIIRNLKKIILVWIHGQLTAIHVHIKSVRADGTGDRSLSCPFDKWWLIIHTLYIFSGVHQATQVLRTALIFRGAHQAKASSSQAHQATQVFDDWQWLIIDYL